MNDRPLHIVTPLIESDALSGALGVRALVKLDALQPTGSFKIRGIGHACQRLRATGSRHFVTSSGGNAGLAVAYAGRKLSVPVTVVVPSSTGERAKQLIRAQGTEPIVVGQSWQEAHEYALSLINDDVSYVHPFDDPLVWAGHASLIDEVLRTAPEIDSVVVAVGGGGLLCGIAAGLRNAARRDVKLIVAETVGADAYAQALAAGRLVTLDAITSIATSLGAKTVAAAALDVAQEFSLVSRVVADREAVDACLQFADDHRVIVEPACGAALAIAYHRDDALTASHNVLIVGCGGAGVTYRDLIEWQTRLR